MIDVNHLEYDRKAKKQMNEYMSHYSIGGDLGLSQELGIKY